MTQSPFSIILDGSNDTDWQKMCPVTVCIFGVNFNCIMKKFFDMSFLERQMLLTTDSMVDSVNNLFVIWTVYYSVWSLGIGLDNTNANIGERSSIQSCARQKNN